jgi:hypothetical protein
MLEELVDTLSSLASQVVCIVKRARGCKWIEPAFSCRRTYGFEGRYIEREKQRKGKKRTKKERSKHNKVH